jgi:hypothetical protein
MDLTSAEGINLELKSNKLTVKSNNAGISPGLLLFVYQMISMVHNRIFSTHFPLCLSHFQMKFVGSPDPDE